jgi:hypothetical protein
MSLQASWQLKQDDMCPKTHNVLEMWNETLPVSAYNHFRGLFGIVLGSK